MRTSTGREPNEVDIDLAQGTSKCNRTFCMKARAWKAFLEPAAFRLVSASDHVTGYRKNPQSSLNWQSAPAEVRHL
jgi:hypothetical protein